MCYITKYLRKIYHKLSIHCLNCNLVLRLIRDILEDAFEDLGENTSQKTLVTKKKELIQQFYKYQGH